MWDTMLSLAKTKDEVIKEKLMLIEHLTFDKAMATIDTIKKSRITQGKEATTVRKLDMQVNRVTPAKTISAISCFRCGRTGHYKSQCDMSPQQCPICKRDHVEAAHKDFPPKEDNRGEGEENTSENCVETKERRSQYPKE